MTNSKPFSGIYGGSQATLDLYEEDEKVRLHEEASRCYLLIVMTHAEPQRERNIFNTSNFCAAAAIPGTTAGLSVVCRGQSFTDWKLPALKFITVYCFETFYLFLKSTHRISLGGEITEDAFRIYSILHSFFRLIMLLKKFLLWFCGCYWKKKKNLSGFNDAHLQTNQSG